MRKLRSENEIMEKWQCTEQPMISICCATYNHADFIEDAIEGFLIQETDFPFEILIHDDASTDGTDKIIMEYEAKYPQIIKPIYQTENQYSKGGKPAILNYKRAEGKYIAVCEGDDYWTDIEKISKQVAYLELHPSVVISGHDAKVIDEYGNTIQESKLPEKHKRDYGSNELVLDKAWILTLTYVFRNIDLTEVPERRMVKNGDKFFISLIGNFGSSHYHKDIESACYRIHSGGVWSKQSVKTKLEMQLNTIFWLYKYYDREGRVDVAEFFWVKYLKLVFYRSSFRDLISSLFKKLLFSLRKNWEN